MAPGLVSKLFLIDPLECLPLVLHVFLWVFPNIQATQGGSFMIILIFLGIITLLNSLMRDLKEQNFILLWQTKIPLLYLPRSSSVVYILNMSFLVRPSPITYLSTSSRLVGIWYGIAVEVRRFASASRLFSWAQNSDFTGFSTGSLFLFVLTSLINLWG